MAIYLNDKVKIVAAVGTFRESYLIVCS